MDGNKDESNRCINIALNASKAGDFPKALKFLRKANCLYPSQKAKGTQNSFQIRCGRY